MSEKDLSPDVAQLKKDVAALAKEIMTKSSNHDASSKEHGASIKDHGDRLGKLEGVVKTMAASRIDTKVDAMDKTLQALNSANLIDEKTFKTLSEASDAKRKAQSDAESKRLADEANKEAKAMVDKVAAENEKQMAAIMKQADTTKLEIRLQVLENQVKTLLAKA